MATTVATNGKTRKGTLAQVERYAVHRDATTSGDVATHFGVSRSTARTRLVELAETGILRQEGKGRGAKYVPTYPGAGDGNGNGNGNTSAKASRPKAAKRPARRKPVARVSEPDLITRLRRDADAELARIDARLEEIAAAQAKLAQEQAALKDERQPVAAARKALG